MLDQLEEDLFGHVGEKIKKASFWACVIGMACSVIAGVILIFTVSFWIGLAVVVGGYLFSWLASLGGYGFGELVENSRGTNRREGTPASSSQYRAVTDNRAPRVTVTQSETAAETIRKEKPVRDINEENKILTDGGWKCPNCGKVNFRYYSRCDCGSRKPYTILKADKGN